MSKRIIAFGASSSKASINKQLATWAANQVDGAEVKVLDLNNYEMPIYSIDRENESGIPSLAQQFKAEIMGADGLIISFAEHNGAYSAAFKNIFDWISRIDRDVWGNKPMLLMATSPGGRGGQTVLGIAFASFDRSNKNTVVSFSLPSFGENFTQQEGIINPELLSGFNQQLMEFAGAL